MWWWRWQRSTMLFALLMLPKVALAQQQQQQEEEGQVADELLICPRDDQAVYEIFPLYCKNNEDCSSQGPESRCCKLFGGQRCAKGLKKPPPEPSHEYILGVVPRRCPKVGETLAETWWQIEECETDRDCWPRVCCPDGGKKYCRTSQPEFNASTLSVARGLAQPLESFTQYMQCTPPPPKIFDLHPKHCNNTLDCFPNLCCAEAGEKICRPPRRSLLSLLTDVSARFNVGFIKEWTDNLVIRRRRRR